MAAILPKGFWNGALTKADLISGDKVCSNSQFNLLGSRTLKAGEQIGIGLGELHGQQDALGRIYVDLRDNTAAPGAVVDGVLQFAYYDANDHLLEVTEEFRTEALRTNKTDRRVQFPLPFMDSMVTKDNKIQMYFKPDTDGVTVSQANSYVYLDVTKTKGQ